jgi:ATP-dependent DNA helicase RecG
MRPDILNPLFAEIEALKGVGPALARPLERLGLARAVDLAFHLPVNWVERRLTDTLDAADAGRMIGIVLTPVDYRAGGSMRAPFRVHAADRHGNIVSLVYFGRNSGWPRKMLPLGEPRFVSGKLEQYGQDLQMIHPDHVLPVEEAGSVPAREPVYPLSEGLSNNRMRELVGQALTRAPDVPEWIEPGVLAQQEWPGWQAALKAVHGDPDAAAMVRDRLAYDEIFAGQLALMLVRASSRRRRGVPISGDGRLRAMLTLPFAPTGAQRRAMAEIEGDMAQATPMLRLLQGDVGAGKTLVALMALLNAVEAGAQGAMLAPTEILARQDRKSVV